MKVFLSYADMAAEVVPRLGGRKPVQVAVPSHSGDDSASAMTCQRVEVQGRSRNAHMAGFPEHHYLRFR